MNAPLSRRSAVKRVIAGSAMLGLARVPELAAAEKVTRKGNIHHSVSKWCYGSVLDDGKGKPNRISFDQFCKACADMGIESVELLGPEDWETVKKNGLTCAMCNGPDQIGYGWNRVDHHDKLVTEFEKAIPNVAKYGFPNIITFSGNRGGMSDEEGIKNCVQGLKRIVGFAEKNKVTMILELLNSKVDHKDYMADHTAWGAEVCRQVGSERLKLLYDIYHMQIMEGDVIRTIKDNIQYIGHFHTGGNPGRNEIDDTQELNYPAIMRAIVATGYKGFVGQEFIPKGRPMVSLQKAIDLCDV